MRSTFGVIMQPTYYPSEDLLQDEYKNRNVISYEDLINKPHIESNELTGNKTFNDLGMTRIDFNELEDIFSS